MPAVSPNRAGLTLAALSLLALALPACIEKLEAGERAAPEMTDQSGAGQPLAPEDEGEPDPEPEHERLKSLGYVGATEVSAADRFKLGLVHVDPARWAGGWSIFTSTRWGPGFRGAKKVLPQRKALLVDEFGDIVHAWRDPRKHEEDVGDSRSMNRERDWANMRMDEAGNVVAVDALARLVKVSWDSELLWSAEGRYHHDLARDDDGTIWALRSEPREMEREGAPLHVWDTRLVAISPETGEELRTISLWDAIHEAPEFQAPLANYFTKNADEELEASDLHEEQTAHRTFDALHANTVKLARVGNGLWKPGDLLASFRSLDMVAVIGRDDGRLRWAYGYGELDGPHSPIQTADGRVVVFANGLRERRRSRVVAIEPESRALTVLYEGDDDNPFFSSIRGQVQELAGGHLLVVESQRGRAFELTPAREIVWEYFSPDTFFKRTKAKPTADGKPGKRGKKLMRVPFRVVRLNAAEQSAAERLLGRSATPRPAS